MHAQSTNMKKQLSYPGRWGKAYRGTWFKAAPALFGLVLHQCVSLQAWYRGYAVMGLNPTSVTGVFMITHSLPPGCTYG